MIHVPTEAPAALISLVEETKAQKEVGVGGEALPGVGVQVLKEPGLKVLTGQKISRGSRKRVWWGADKCLTIGSLGKKVLTCSIRPVSDVTEHGLGKRCASLALVR